MGYVPGYAHDIFISYAHADDALDPQGVRWATEFQVYLKRAVKQHLAGHEPDVFFDALDLHPNNPVSVVLSHARESAIFLPVISPSYVERPWPNDELNAFSKAVAEPDRIFAVELLPPIGDYPEPLCGLKRKQFWWLDEMQGSAPRKSTPKYESQRYTDYLDDVAYLIARRLREMRTGGSPKPAVAAPPITGKTVLLAEVTDDLRRTRRRVREYLEQFQFNVLPKQDYRETPADFAKDFEADLAQANVFVQLISEVRSSRDIVEPGKSEPISRGQFQYQAAQRRGVPTLQWRGPEVETAAATHYDQALLMGSQVLVMGLQEFMKEIKKTLDRPAPEPSKKKEKGEFIFINADNSDKELSDKLLVMFENRRDWLVMEPLFDGTADQILEDLEANLRDCAALLVIYGNSRPPWVRAQLRRYNKLEKSRDEAPRLKTILLAPPGPKSERDIGYVGGFAKIDCQNGLSDDVIQRIVSELQ